MGKLFAIVVDNVVVTTAKTLIWLNPGTSRKLRLVEAGVSQSASTTSAIQRVQLVLQASAFPSTLTSFTPVPLSSEESSVISGSTGGLAGTCGILAGTEGAGTKTVWLPDNWNTVNGNWRWVAGPDAPEVPAGGARGFGLYLPAIAGGSQTISAYMHYVEI